MVISKNVQFSNELFYLEKSIRSLREHGIQSPEKALYNRLSRLIARHILDENGHVDLKSLKMVENIIQEKQYPPNNYHNNLISKLQRLYKDKVTRNIINQIDKIPPKDSPGDFILQVSSDLDPIQLSAEKGVKVAVISALLSYLRQGLEGSCFIFPLILQLLHQNMSLCAKDLTELIITGKLSKEINGIQRDITFLQKISDVDLANNFTIDPKADKPFSHLTGISKALKSIDISDVDHVLDLTMQNSPEQTQWTAYSLIKKVIKTLNLSFPRIKLFRACLSFSAVTHNPTLSIYRNVFTSMAEQAATGPIYQAFIQSLEQAAKEFLPEMLLKQWIDCIKSHINIYYDPMIRKNAFTQTLRCTEGAYTLHYTNPKSSEIIQITNLKTFNEFLDIIMEQCDYLSPEQKQFHKKKEFLDTLFESYSSQFSRYRDERYRPWCTPVGNNFEKLRHSYFPTHTFPKSYSFRPKSIKDLFYHILIFIKSLSEKNREDLKKDGQKSYAVRVKGLHTFSLLPGHPTLVKYWDQTQSAKEIVTLKDNVNPLGDLSQEMYIQCVHEISHLLGEKQRELFLQSIDTHSPKTTTPQQLRKLALKEIFRLYQLKKHDISFWKAKVDTKILAAIPSKLLDKYTDNMILFGDTNWALGLHNKMFSLMNHPISGELHLFIISSDKKQLEPIDIEKWILSKEWYFSYILPDDSSLKYIKILK